MGDTGTQQGCQSGKGCISKPLWCVLIGSMVDICTDYCKTVRIQRKETVFLPRVQGKISEKGDINAES